MQRLSAGEWRGEEAPAEPRGLTQGARTFPAPLPRHPSSCRDAVGPRVRIRPRRLQHLTGFCARAPEPRPTASIPSAPGSLQEPERAGLEGATPRMAQAPG